MSALTDIQSLTSALTSYWSSMGQFLQGTAPAPSLSVLTSVSTGSLVQAAEGSYDSNVGLTMGGLLERIDAYNGVSRDINLRQLPKAVYYSQGVSEFENMSTIETAEATHMSNFITGSTPVQTMGLV